MEYSVKTALSAMTSTKIYDIGLVISAKQPFLTCSPDGIIVNGMEMELIEIKCPYLCKDSVIIDKNENKSLVDYLILNALGEPELKQTHIYYSNIYTQMQTSLYITGLVTIVQVICFLPERLCFGKCFSKRTIFENCYP